ncbi:type I-E CRISPR-associated protein Cas5/CasD [Gallaecimonas sp. GXIMD4217]|uniref:type I-E CRISPR-associated protein Cas5/CasD n=1 Tax=Gallaecimonas sp. GXIMD4217 TaxID=3131927 RepID=UPI00311B2C68
MDYLIFRLYGPMASWGEAAVGGDRPTALHPGRAAVLGLVACALGIPREDAERQAALRDGLAVAVKQYDPGDLLRDYHTAQVPSEDKKRRLFTRADELARPRHKLNTVLSSRDYRTGGLWVVALWRQSESAPTLERLREALLRPGFVPYLGRKACPLALPMAPRIVADGTLRQALDSEFPPLLGSPEEDKRWLGLGELVTYYWQGSPQALGESDAVQTLGVWDEPLSRRPWQFGQRQQHELTIREA